ncbi:hypothetical protein H2201_003245 [Coniosporium apollinis]|uniref:Acyltransferase MbtK/IucB-like conserved domain-containing protein n=2 Tax=Coniosporium TaxID=2810619 RepID=A0ABQ9NW30_9PEZI|nr:hypothetical protein H2199_008707 [Cladosporium sp. JES 115]KAJ9666586.1 hypothetical protein H2201_003245 [Coniosporium apollinis]
MAPAIVHLPNGTNLTVTPVFGGLFFKSNELSKHPSAFPPGWTVVLHCEDEEEDHVEYKSYAEYNSAATSRVTKIRHIHRFKKPTLRNDHLYISSISNPSSSEFKPASSPTRQIAMMLWATLWWYFHQPEPNVRLNTSASEKTPDPGKPKGDWRININREGIFKGKVVLPKLERMGLIASEDSCVGADQDERSGEGWLDMFVSRRSFWQLDARIYLFTLSPMANSPYPSGSPYQSRPSSPSGEGNGRSNDSNTSMPQGLWSPSAPGPFHSSSHLPTYYPPPPAQYIFTNDIRHPLRQKPPRQGETFYTRYVPSCEQYISFRVACLSNDPPKHHGPVSSLSSVPTLKSSTLAMANSFSDSVVPTVAGLNLQMCDPDLLHKWMNDPRISYYWGEDGPRSHQETFLRKGLRSKHSFPVIGCWDGKPFGYFEIYWVKEDALGKHLGGDVGDFDRGIHCLVGEQEYRGAHRVRVWLSALVHYCWLADNRTETVILEPRVDNDK